MGGGAKPLAIALTAVGLICALALAPGAGAAKKKGGGGGTVDITMPVNQFVPDRVAAATAPYGQLSSTITVGKQFKGKQIRDVNVTVQATGATGMNAIADLRMRLVAPNGASTGLLGFLNPGNLLGPLTLDDEAPFFLGVGLPGTDPQTLYAPWQGSAEPAGAPLYVMDGGPVRGAWTLRVVDVQNTDTNVLNSWRLNVVAGRPFETK